MSCGDRQYWLALPCPNCGQKDSHGAWKGARMSSSGWGHNYSCCSQKCGLEYNEKLKTSDKPNQIANLHTKIACLEQELREGKL